MSDRKPILHKLISEAAGGAFFISALVFSFSTVCAQNAPSTQPDPSSSRRPLFQELNRESQSLFQDVAGSIVRVQLPLSASAMVEDPLQKWALDPAVRRRIDEITRRSPQNSISRVDVQPSTMPSGADPTHGGQYEIKLQIARFTPNCVGIVFDDQQHLLIPKFVEKDAFDGPVLIQMADGRIGSAEFVASDRLADLTILQLANLKGKAAVVSPDQPENGALLLVMSLNNAFNRLAVWEGWEPDVAVIVTIDSRIAGFTREGRFLCAATFTPAAKQLIEHGLIHRAVLGVTIHTVDSDDPQRLLDVMLGETPALRITEVRAGTAADRAGLRPGDLILKLAGKVVGDGPSFAAAIADLRGNTELTILRDGQTKSITVDLQVQ
jgi:S1-C subfamily serine protease